jgi:hypothetical protein
MHPHLYDHIEQLLTDGKPVTVREILGWIDFREHMIATNEELAWALTALHQAGRCERVLEGYVARSEGLTNEPFRVPTAEEYEAAVQEYKGRPTQAE